MRRVAVVPAMSRQSQCIWLGQVFPARRGVSCCTRAVVLTSVRCVLSGGLKAAGKSAAIGGILLAVIEGVGIMFTKMVSDPSTTGALLSDDMMKDQLQQQHQQALDQAKKNAEQDDTKDGWWSEGGSEGVAAPSTVGLASGASS